MMVIMMMRLLLLLFVHAHAPERTNSITCGQHCHEGMMAITIMTIMSIITIMMMTIMMLTSHHVKLSSAHECVSGAEEVVQYTGRVTHTRESQ